MLGKVCEEMIEGIDRLEIISQQLNRYRNVSNNQDRTFLVKDTGKCQETKYNVETDFELSKKESVEQTFNAMDVTSRGGR